MTSKTTLSIAKISAVVFLSATIVFAAKYFGSQKGNQELQKSIKLDKTNHTNELSEIFKRLDSVVYVNQNMALKHGLIKSDVFFKQTKSQDKITLLSQEYSLKNNYLQKKTIDSLKLILKKQLEVNKTYSDQIAILIEKNKDLSSVNSKNQRVLSTADKLTATNVYANGIKIVSNNIIETKKFHNTEQIKVCFTLLENNATLKGNKEIYIQIINPKNRIVSKDGKHIDIQDKSLFYSAKTSVYYENEQLDVCAFVDSSKDDIVKGDYEINIYSGTKIIGNTYFSLK